MLTLILLLAVGLLAAPLQSRLAPPQSQSQSHLPPHSHRDPPVSAEMWRALSDALAYPHVPRELRLRLGNMSDAQWRPSAKEPLLLVMGAQKSGSTSLFEYIRRSAWARVAFAKELHFFDHCEVVRRALAPGVPRAELDLLRATYYSSWNSPGTRRGTVRVEVTPAYLNNRHCADVLANVLRSDLAHLRVVVLLREPAARAYSGAFALDHTLNQSEAEDLLRWELPVLQRCWIPSHNCSAAAAHYAALGSCVQAWNKAHQRDTPWFERYTRNLCHGAPPEIRRFAWRYEGAVARGIYADQLRALLCAGIQARQILVLASHTLRHHPDLVVQRIADFVGVTEHRWASDQDALRVKAGFSANARAKGQMRSETKTALTRFYDPLNRDLLQLLSDYPFQVNVSEIAKELTP